MSPRSTADTLRQWRTGSGRGRRAQDFDHAALQLVDAFHDRLHAGARLCRVTMDFLQTRPEFHTARLVDLEDPIAHADVVEHLSFAGIGRLTDVETRDAMGWLLIRGLEELAGGRVPDNLLFPRPGGDVQDSPRGTP